MSTSVSWEGNRRSGVAQDKDTHPPARLNGIRPGNEHIAYAAWEMAHLPHHHYGLINSPLIPTAAKM